MLHTMQRVLSSCCCCCCQSSDEEEDTRLVVESNKRIPCTVSTQIVNGVSIKHTMSCSDIPFAIPTSRKTTPVQGPRTENSDDDESECSPTRSRTSTADTLCKGLGELDATLYIGYDSDDDTTYPYNHLGRVWYSLLYDNEEEQLAVTLIKAKNLPVGRKNENRESSIRVSLVPDEKRYLQSQTKSAQSNPTFNECFKFPLSSRLVEERCVQFTLYQNEAGKKSESKAQATIQLDKSLLETTEAPTASKCWVDLDSRRPSQQMVKRYQKGKMLLSLKYDGYKQRLFVIVFRCIRLQHTNPTDVVLKVELTSHSNNSKRVRKKKGHVVQQSDDELDFNELFKFSIPEDNLADSSISISIKPAKVIDKHTGCHARTVLGGIMLAAGRELEHWQIMIDHPDEEHIQWHDLC